MNKGKWFKRQWEIFASFFRHGVLGIMEKARKESKSSYSEMFERTAILNILQDLKASPQIVWKIGSTWDAFLTVCQNIELN